MSTHDLQPGEVLPPWPPLEAYRRDAEHLSQDAASDVGAWLLPVAVLLARYAESPDSERLRLRKELRGALRHGVPSHDLGAVGASSTSASSAYIPETDSTSTAIYQQDQDALWLGPAVRDFANVAEDLGAFHLAYSTLSLNERIHVEDLLERGRSTAQRGRIARKLGKLEMAAHLYQMVLRLNTRAKSKELRARAYLGYGVVAHVRGSYPVARKWYQRAARVADAYGITDVSSMAHHGLMIAASVAGELEQALLEGWAAFAHAGGDVRLEAEMLLNIGQLLLEMDRPESATCSFAAALTRTSLPRLTLPAWGGLAVAAARRRHVGLVHQAALRIDTIAGHAILPYDIISAQFDLATAYLQLGMKETAEHYQRRTLAASRSHGFHEFVYRAETLGEKIDAAASPVTTSSGTPELPLTPTALAVVREVERLGDAEAVHVNA